MAAQLEPGKLLIGCLRSSEDNERVGAACLNYSCTWQPDFYPERMDLFQQAQQVAVALGGHLEVPHSPWKYALIEALFGWRAAKRVQLRYNEGKWTLLRAWDKILFERERRNTPDLT